MSRELALYKHWNQKPPAHWLIAGYLQYKPTEQGSISDLAEGGLPNV